MSQGKRVFLLIAIITVMCVIVTWVTITVLYRAALNEQRTRLMETAQSQARLIEAVSRFAAVHQKKWHPHVGIPEEATLRQVIDAHKHYKGFGETGEFTLAKKEGDNIIFLLSHRHYDLNKPKPVSFDSKLAEPMRLALSGESGTVIGLDYRGETVLAAYEPVEGMNLGIVAKIDLAEIRAPFVRAGIISGLVAVLAILSGAGLFVMITKPMIRDLTESEERFRAIFEQAAVGVGLVEAKTGRFFRVNQKYCDIVGYTQEEMVGTTFMEITHPDDLQLSLDTAEKQIRGEIQDYALEKRYVKKDGSIVWVNLNISSMSGINERTNLRIAMVEDITKRKLAETALQEMKENLDKAQEIAHIGNWRRDLKLNQCQWSDEMYRILGLIPGDSAEPSFEFFLSRVHPDDRDRVTSVLREAAEKSGSFDFEFRTVPIEGSERIIRNRGGVEYDETGTPVRLFGTDQDITEHVKAEEALRESEEKYRTILEDMEEGYYEVDLEGNLTFFNDYMLKIRGYSRDEFIGTNYRDYMDERTAKEVYQVYNKVYSTGIPVKGFGWKITRRDGTIGYVEASITLIKDSEGAPTGFRGVVRNVTEQKLAEEEKKRLEDQLHKAQRMESLGLMAGGIAHDLNNILAGIVAYPDLLLLDLPQDSPLREPIEAIKESGLRAADVVADLLTVAKGAAISKEVLNLNSIVEKYLNSPEHKRLKNMRPSVVFKTEVESDLLSMNGSPAHIKKALMNLIANASDAIETSGTVTISTSNRYLDQPLKLYEDVRQGEYTVLSVSDDGSGISPDDLERIFEPFYTKKMMGRSGTGLGLAVVWNTVQDHNGYIDVRGSEKGTVFELYFPVTREAVVSEKEEVPLKDYLGHGEKVLVIDDEERQRDIACGFLTRLGYDAKTVSSGEEAIKYVKEHPVDLIVLDMIMPEGINGRETYEEIIKIRPGQKAIIASGFSETEDVKIAQKLGAGKYIKKPYTLEKIGISLKEEFER